MEKRFVSAIIIAVGVASLGLFIFLGFRQMAYRDRGVSVKGLSQRTVKADHVVWPLSFAASGNDLSSLYKYLGENGDRFRDFLLEKGFKAEDISFGNIDVTDNWNSYYDYDHRPEHQYSMSRSIIISTDDVDLVIANQGCYAELLAEGYILSSDDWCVDYQYNGLNELKPIMIEEATKNARAVAQKFADDAQCKLGSIRNACQGQFSIDDDVNKPWMKNVRVVTTIDYYLK